jgi:hypothetical protein
MHHPIAIEPMMAPFLTKSGIGSITYERAGKVARNFANDVQIA